MKGYKMKKTLVALAVLCAGLTAAQTTVDQTQLLIYNVNSSVIGMVLEAGLGPGKPYVQIMVIHPDAAADGYRIHLTYADGWGEHSLDADTPMATYLSNGQVTAIIIQTFIVDAYSSSLKVTATPYRLNRAATVATTP